MQFEFVAESVTAGGYIRYLSQELTIPSGLSYLPVNTICAVNVAGFFKEHPGIVMIKDMAQTGIYWPAFNINTLEKLFPGVANQVYNSIAGEILVSTINGQLVFSTLFGQQTAGAKLNIDLSGLKMGVYYLRISSAQFTKIEKVILD